MDSELKTYLDNQFDSVRTEVKKEISEVLEVIKDVAENTSKIMEKLDDGLLDVRQRVDHVSKRVDYIEENLVHK